MITYLRPIKEGIIEVLFPNVCVVCNLKLSKKERFVCTICVNERFELANPDDLVCSSNVFLPEGVLIQHALWDFDKGGHLQDLLHLLKYSRLTGLGKDLGVALGANLLMNSHFNAFQDSILVPVPLHPRKERIRGYNQAYHIAKGIREVTGLQIVPDENVIRVKNTRTQTGFSLENRRKNIESAFQVKGEKAMNNKTFLIVDDVFTTGATAFELAKVLQLSGAKKIGIVTVAQA